MKTNDVPLKIDYLFQQSRFGKVLIASTKKGVCFVWFSEDESVALNELKKIFPEVGLSEFVSEIHTHVIEIIEGEKRMPADLPLDMRGTEFQQKVWNELLKIPPGITKTYGEIALQIGKPTASRAVGNAVARNHIAYLIPCHRVVRATKEMGNYRWGKELKSKMIEQEIIQQK